MGVIKVLSEAIANKIAAGEVIERPASIVKELVENALDAGATSVEISIQHGGKSFIRVADNGSGMSAEDAKLAFQRHATSKISAAEDLDHIRSFGFRGEALPSIAAVSRTKLLTRAKGDTAGTEVVIEGGHRVSVQPKACREGTIIEVRDLFFNTPARRKFVKTEPTEMGHVMEMVSHFALAMPQVAFSLKSSEKTLLDLLPVQNPLDRGSAVFGKEESAGLLEIEGEGTGIRISGFIGKPATARANRTGQVIFVNHRWVKALSLSYAIQDGYHGLLMHGQFPVACLFIDVDPARVDVNVHPTKQEVRISNESEIKSLIRRTVTERLQKEGDLAPDLKFKPQATPFQRAASFQNNVQRASYLEFLEKVAVTTEPFQVKEAPAEYEVSKNEKLAQPISLKDKLHITKILGQIHHTFIVAETEEGMIIVDQHAAHERVMFEVLLQEFENGRPKRQGLLMDEILEIHPKQQEIFKSAIPFLEKLGFEIEPFGEHAYVIRAYPAILEGESPVTALKHFLEEKEDGKLQTGLESLQEEVAALIACKRKSVKAHDVLTAAALQSLLERLAACQNPFNCPHGRPTFFKQTFLDLEKQFKRK